MPRIMAGTTPIKDGLGNNDIAQQLHKAAKSKFINRSKFYWEIVANSFIGRGRAFATLSSFNEAGINRYVFEAVLDEATTEPCRFYHGKTFTTGRGLELFEDAEARPDLVKDIVPWIRKGRDDNGNQFLYIRRGETITKLADIVKSGMERRDTIGRYSNALNESQLSALGVVMPPLHGLCRSTILPIV